MKTIYKTLADYKLYLKPLKLDNMLLHEIITTMESGTQSILTEILFKYKKSLYIYFKSYYNCEPLLMVTSVFNACSYALIVPSNELSDAMDIYLADSGLDEEDKEAERETISFNSRLLKDF